MGANRFTFDTVFAGATDVVSDQARARQRRVFTQGEIDAMRASARDEGVKSGEVRAQEALAAATAHAANAIRNALARSHDDVEALRVEASQLALAAAKRLATEVLGRLPEADVEQALRRAMHEAIGEPRLLLRANPRVVEILAPSVEAITHEEGFEGRVQMVADPSQPAADCRLEWRGGGAERSQAAIEAAIAELIARSFAHHPQPTVPEN